VLGSSLWPDLPAGMAMRYYKAGRLYRWRASAVPRPCPTLGVTFKVSALLEMAETLLITLPWSSHRTKRFAGTRSAGAR
jgi:hypothetical protein